MSAGDELDVGTLAICPRHGIVAASQWAHRPLERRNCDVLVLGRHGLRECGEEVRTAARDNQRGGYA